ncbi:MAG TPA: M20/M25/M40 family metallo-hydrolase [Candidatus Acidoferrales bacterium]|nr:M20/M25/M40 family metallo-hydrolase [Candidatus Acidoferrales bacterium]
MKALKEAGFDNAHFEEYTFEPRWQRGFASGRIVSPVEQSVVIGSYGWVPGTSGTIEARLVDLASPKTDHPSLSGLQLRDSAVLVDVHDIGPQPLEIMRALLARQLASARAAAMLIPSDKPDRMVYTSAWGFYPKGPMPVLSIAKEDSLLLRRLLAKGKEVTVSLDVQNTFIDLSARERNVVADLPGEDASEVVALGAHFDSWDYAQGADDNASGVAAVLEAARILKALGVKPKCTIRFVFFSGEEQANLGSRAYIAQHKTELDHYRAFLMMDGGAETPVGFKTNGREDVSIALQSVLRPLASLGASKVSNDADLESDNASFMAAGIPSLTLDVEPGDYDARHHGIADTLDRVNQRALATDTAAMAIASYVIADAANPLGRRLSNAEVRELFRKTGLEKTQEVLFGSLAP